MPELAVSRGADRFRTVGDGVQTWHSFSYGVHYDPDRIGFGPIMAINTEHVAPGRGYDVHVHADVEIVTWVLEGVLSHDDSTGQSGDIRPGTAQRLSAGTGVQHAERNGSADEPLVFVQMMLRSDHDGAPEYAQVDVPEVRGEVVPTVAVHAAADLSVLRLDAGDAVTVEGAGTGRMLLIVARGAARVADVALDTGDELRVTGAGPLTVTADGPAELLVWALG